MRKHVVGKEMDLPVTMDGKPYISRGLCIGLNDRFATYEFDFHGVKIKECYCLYGPLLTRRELDVIRRSEEEYIRGGKAEPIQKIIDRISKEVYGKGEPEPERI